MTSSSRHLQDAATWGLLVVLISVTAVFGGVEAASRAWLFFGATACLTAAVWSTSLEALTTPIRRLALPVAAIVLWGLVQMLPLPGPVLGAIAPKTRAVYRATVPPGGGASLPSFLAAQAVETGVKIRPGQTVPQGPPDTGGFGLGRSVSIAPMATLAACRSWLIAGVVFLTAALVAQHARQRSRLLWGISAWGGFLGLSVVVQSVVGQDWFLLTRRIPADTIPLGPFVNKNHFGAYVMICALVAIGLILAHVARPVAGLSWRSVREAMLDTEWALPRALALIAAAAVAIAGLVLSVSQGAWLGTGIGFLVILWGRRRPAVPAGILVAVMIAGVAVGVGSLIIAGDVSPIAPYVSQQPEVSVLDRFDTWARTTHLFTQHLVSGTGLGTFGLAFQPYQRAGEWADWQQAHNEYLQFLAEAGLIGVVFIGFGLVWLVRGVFVPALASARAGSRWTTIGVAAAVVAASVHSIVEFILQIPALAVLVATLLGILAAAASDPLEEEAA